MSNKKYNIVQKIEDDAPFGNINWCTISFLTPQKIESIKFLDVKGFKVHNGYNTDELANIDAKKIKERNKNHDVYLSELGKIYAWDDATRTDEVEYNDNKLNDLEKTRRENIDKIKLMSEQFKNEYKTLHANVNSERREQQYKRMQKKLYERGLITKKEYEMIKEEIRPMNEIKDEAARRETVDAEIEECSKIDYLDENEPTGLKYGCMTIYSPRHIGGLSTLCFKIRGLFQTQSELTKRIKRIESLYPNDRIYTFEVGKWCAFSEKDNIETSVLLKQLNYSMKCYIDNLEHEKEEFDKRKEKLQSKTEQESKAKLANNRKEKRKNRLLAKKAGNNQLIDNTDHSVQPSSPKNDNAKSVTEENKITSMGNAEDDAAIIKILNYLDDPELKNKFTTDKTNGETVTVDVSNN